MRLFRNIANKLLGSNLQSRRFVPLDGAKPVVQLCLLCALLVLPAERLAAQTSEKDVKTIIRSWQLPDDLAVADTVQMDTSFLNLPMKEMPHTYSIANSYNGNLVSPIEAKIYFDRQDKIDFLFARAYMPYILTPSDVQYYNTTTPYSKIAYKKGFTTYREENDLDFAFTANLTPDFNLGLTLNYLNAVGHYNSQSGKRFNGSLFASYNGSHYGCRGAVMFNSLSNFENGGILSDSVDYLSSSLKTEDIPVNLEGMSAYKYISGFFNHHYSICVERERQVTPDSVTIDYIPVTTFMHTFEVNQSTKRYVEQRANQGFYAHSYFNEQSTRDTANVLNIRNTLAVTFEEEFNKWLRFGAKVYAVNECQRYAFSVPDTTPLFDNMVNNDMSHFRPVLLHSDSTMGYQWVNNTWVGGAIYKNTGKYIRYGFVGDVCVVGYKLGEFKVNGHINTDFRVGKDTMRISANAYVKNEQPDYFLQHYRSNHFCWNNDFGKTYRFYVGGQWEYPTRYVQPSVRVGFENLTHYIYFDENGLPRQHTGNIQVLAVDAQLNIRTKRFGMDNNVVYQLSSDEALPLPSVALYHNIYYRDCWFKALDVQIGVDMRYNTAYYAPLLNPATGQFCIQHKEKVGNYPILNVYANFYVRSLRLKLFAHFTHFNQYFMKHKTYYSMPGYPLNPPVFRAGLAWHFYK